MKRTDIYKDHIIETNGHQYRAYKRKAVIEKTCFRKRTQGVSFIKAWVDKISEVSSDGLSIRITPVLYDSIAAVRKAIDLKINKWSRVDETNSTDS